MNKIQEKFEKWVKNGCSQEDLDFGNIPQYSWLGKTEPRAYHGGFKAGYKSANLLPTTKICLECEGSGEVTPTGYGTQPSNVTHSKCQGTGKIQIYYTPEEYKEITGEDFPDDAYVHYHQWTETYDETSIFTYSQAKSRINECHIKYTIYIVQTAQIAPEANYRREE